MYNNIRDLFANWLEQGRLPHSILLHGRDLEALDLQVKELSSLLLEEKGDVQNHPDFFVLKPENRMRRIAVDAVRALIGNIYQSPNKAQRKVVVIYDADRMYTAASNAFLKTLEEPPLNTVIFLITNYPYRLLPTIRSRCFNLFVPSGLPSLNYGIWQEWLYDYQNWFTGILEGMSTVDVSMMSVYGLLSRFSVVLKELSSSLWKEQKAVFSDQKSSDEMAILEVSFYKELRSKLFTQIGLQTRDSILAEGVDNATIAQRASKFSQTITVLEKSIGLIEVNLNEVSALEVFLLESLKIWYQRKKAC